MNSKNVWMVLMGCLALTGETLLGVPVIDDSPTRVQTTLDPKMELVGTLRPKSVGEIKTSHWTLGCETIDREYSDYHAWKEYLPPLGISRIRLQAGWARCEKDPGIYDFGWLDSIIFDAQKRGITVWLETSYGNPAYPGGGGRTLADGMPSSPEGLAAWDRWVGVMAKRYKGVVRDWSVWNEPELFSANKPDVITDFMIRTAEVIKREIPDARVAALSICNANVKIVESFVKALKARGKADLFTWIVHHHYTANPDQGYQDSIACQKVMQKYAPHLRLWQGESGIESEWCRNGALSKTHWTEWTQAKWNARRYLGDLGHDEDTEVFTAADLDYRTTSFHNGLVRYGLIKTAGQRDGFRVLKVKTAYYAVQNIVSVFNDDVEKIKDFDGTVTGAEKTALFGFLHRTTGIPLVVFWDKSGKPQESNATVPVTISFRGKAFAKPVWVDTLSGNVYAVPDGRMQVEDGRVTFSAVPVYDAPAFLTDASILTMDASEFVQYGKKAK